MKVKILLVALQGYNTLSLITYYILAIVKKLTGTKVNLVFTIHHLGSISK